MGDLRKYSAHMLYMWKLFKEVLKKITQIKTSMTEEDNEYKKTIVSN